MNTNVYYIIFKGTVYLREYVGWKNAYKAAKRFNRRAFIIDKVWHESNKKRRDKVFNKNPRRITMADIDRVFAGMAERDAADAIFTFRI